MKLNVNKKRKENFVLFCDILGDFLHDDGIPRSKRGISEGDGRDKA